MKLIILAWCALIQIDFPSTFRANHSRQMKTVHFDTICGKMSRSHIVPSEIRCKGGTMQILPGTRMCKTRAIHFLSFQHDLKLERNTPQTVVTATKYVQGVVRLFPEDSTRLLWRSIPRGSFLILPLSIMYGPTSKKYSTLELCMYTVTRAALNHSLEPYCFCFCKTSRTLAKCLAISRIKCLGIRIVPTNACP